MLMVIRLLCNRVNKFSTVGHHTAIIRETVNARVVGDCVVLCGGVLTCHQRHHCQQQQVYHGLSVIFAMQVLSMSWGIWCLLSIWESYLTLTDHWMTAVQILPILRNVQILISQKTKSVFHTHYFCSANTFLMYFNRNFEIYIYTRR